MYIYFVFLEEIGSRVFDILGELGELGVVPYKYRKRKDKYSFDHTQVHGYSLKCTERYASSFKVRVGD